MKKNSFLKLFNGTIIINIVIILLISLQTVYAQENCVCATCDKPCNQVNISGHRPGYSCYTGGSNSSSGSSSSGVNTSSPIAMGVGLATVGALTGLLIDAKNGKDYSVSGGFGGLGLGIAIGLANSSKERSVVENLVYSSIAGASLGIGVAEAEKANSDDPAAKKDNTVERVLEGVALGIIADGLFTGFKKKTKGGYSNNKSSLLSKMYITMYSNRIGLRVSL